MIKIITEILSSNTLKITFSEDEFTFIGTNFDSIDNNSAKSKLFFEYLLDNIIADIGIDLRDEHLCIEAFNTSSGGCIMYLSIPLNQIDFREYIHPNSAETIIFETYSISNLIALGVQLNLRYTAETSDCRLFASNDKIRLLFTANNELLDSAILLMCEYGMLLGNSPSLIERTVNTFNEIPCKNILSTLASLSKK